MLVIIITLTVQLGAMNQTIPNTYHQKQALPQIGEEIPQSINNSTSFNKLRKIDE